MDADMPSWALGCQELREVGLVPADVICCGSCHDDADEGYAGLCEEYDPRPERRSEVWAVTCCAVSRALDLALEGKTA